jgi:outer membrane immunogenic protein
MRKHTLLAAFGAALVTTLLAAPGFAQTPGASNPRLRPPVELTVTYSAVRTNAPVGDCGCFWLHGGTAEVAVPLSTHIALVGEVSGEKASEVPGYDGIGLNLISGMGGVRVSRQMHSHFIPFIQALVGGVHAFDSYFPGSTTIHSDATSFVLAAGGGLDIALSRHWVLRPAQADYHYMELPNGTSDQQHDVRLSGGIGWRF